MRLDLPMLVIVLLVVAAVALWYDSMRVREAANRVAADACRRRSLQLLDGTVALAAMRLRWSGGLRFERTYVFDYAVGGMGRATGFVIMLGHEPRHVGLETRG